MSRPSPPPPPSLILYPLLILYPPNPLLQPSSPPPQFFPHSLFPSLNAPCIPPGLFSSPFAAFVLVEFIAQHGGQLLPHSFPAPLFPFLNARCIPPGLCSGTALTALLPPTRFLTSLRGTVLALPLATPLANSVAGAFRWAKLGRCRARGFARCSKTKK